MLGIADQFRMPAFVLFALGLLACNDPEGPRPPDVEPPAAAPAIPWLADGMPVIAPPVIPWLGGDPLTRPCAPGWRAAPRRSGVACEPWPEAGRAVCVGPTAHFPGEAGCRGIGAACPSGDYAEGLPAGAIYVRPGATGTTGGAGDPVGTLTAALALVPPGGVVALSRGVHEGDALLRNTVELRGACAGATHLAGVVRALSGTIALSDLALAGLTVEGAAVRASGLWIEDAPGTAIDVSAGSLSLDDALVRGGFLGPAAPSYAVRVSVGQLSASRLAIERAPGWALYLTNRGTASLDGAVIIDTRVGPDGHANALFAQAAAGNLALRRSVVHGGVGTMVAIEGGTATLEDVLLEHNVARAGESVGFAVALLASMTGRGVQLRDFTGFGLAVAAGHTDLEDVSVESTAPDVIGLHVETAGSLSVVRARLGPIATGLQTFLGGQLEASDVLVFQSSDHPLVSRGNGASAVVRRLVVEDCARGARAGDDSTLTLEDAVFRDVSNGALLGDDAVGAFLRSVVTVRRVTAERVANSCFAALQAGTMLTVEDATCTGGSDLGLLGAYGATLDASRVHLADGLLAGIVSEGATVHVRDVFVERVGPAEQVSSAADSIAGGELTLERARIEEIHGYGASTSGSSVTDGTVSRLALTDVAIGGAELGGLVTEAQTTLARVSIERVAEVGLSLDGAAAQMVAEDLTVRDVGSRIDGQLGRGVHLANGAHLQGARLVVARARGAGLLVTGAGTTADLTDFWVSETAREECGDGCAERAAGSGIVATEGGAATITGVRSWGNVLAGVQVASGGGLTLADGWVFDNAIGRSVLTAIAPEQLTLGVVYVGNTMLESSASVSVPAPSLF